RGIDDDELASQGRDLADVAVPVEEALVEPPHFLDERRTPVQPRLGNDAADGLAELHDDALFCFIDSECGVDDDEQQCRDTDSGYDECLVHCSSSPVLTAAAGASCRRLRRSRFSSGSAWPSCITTTEPMRGSTSRRVSMYKRE